MRVLRDSYVPAVGQHEVFLQGPLRDWWLSTVRQANPRYSGGSTQGYYVLNASAEGLLWDNFIPRLGQFLQLGLTAFRQSPPPNRELPQVLVRSGATLEAPAGASVLRLYTRIRPLPADAGPMNAMLGRDYMWVLPEEVRELVVAAVPGQSVPLPPTLAARLVVFHLVDNVRGQVWPWQPQSVSQATLTARVLRSEGAIRTYSLSGSYAKSDSHPPQWRSRGQQGRLDGELAIDVTSNRIVRFRALVESLAWSDAGYSPVAMPPVGRYPLLTAIVEATDDLARRVPPEPAHMGRGYLQVRLPVR